ncbi:hypothetical protein GLAREA_10850 [Glarea lozoyensis ATCC 20868]|uniref:RlpA-like protein double-psi beta-barrel domain-containing protein n=1 Tax=Glarea lozoyensis (strain ATCC 20868 / MF5171) TaxID=1116229 RepID=S3DDH2_GLAL2|nr:uncharacterized protein GLAREA_10850 [Glarea lozoyensis ATCC 20868]EPE35154.1 hypothetical protein GLAREA_10850 [Glarea lozoyensis ATCC 20868]
MHSPITILAVLTPFITTIAAQSNIIGNAITLGFFGPSDGPLECGQVVDGSELLVSLPASANLPCGSKVSIGNGERVVIVGIAGECAECADTDLAATSGLFNILQGGEFDLVEVPIVWSVIP